MGGLVHRLTIAWDRLASSSGDGGWNFGFGRGRCRLTSITDRWKLSVGFDLPGAGGEVWAHRSGEGGLVVICADTSRSERSPVLAQVLKVGAFGLRRAVSAKGCIGAIDDSRGGLAEAVFDETVVVGFLDPFVDDGTGPGVDHLVAEDGSLIVKCASGADIATSLGEEDRDVVLGGVLLQEDVAGGLVSGVSAPVKSQWKNTYCMRRQTDHS